MQIGLLFWVLYILLIICGGWAVWPDRNYRIGGVGLVLLILIFLLGWKCFGFIIQG